MKKFQYSIRINKSDYPLLFQLIFKSGSNIICLMPLMLEGKIPKHDSNIECFVKLANIKQQCTSPICI